MVESSVNEMNLDEDSELISASEPNAKEMASDSKVDGEERATEENDGIPRVGLSFKSFDEVYEFYNQYARNVGFGTKIRRSFYSLDDGQLNKVMLTCCKEGRREYKNQERSTYRLRLSARTDCQARIKVQRKYIDGLFHLTEVNLEHNHPVNPTMSKFFRSHKDLNDGPKKQLPARGKIQKDLVSTEKENEEVEVKLQGPFWGREDLEALNQFFVKMQLSGSYFFHLMDFDGGGRLKNVFWADGRSKAAYKYFGDVVRVDTMYLMDNYETPLVMFTGVNNHGHLVLLGCGLLSERNVDAFIWLFKSWLACMSGNHPSVIITDHSQAIRGAVAAVFPGVRHHMCLQHIMREMQDNLGELSEYKAVKGLLKRAIYDCLRIEEFEEDWQNMIEKHMLQDNAWLESLYESRHSWAPVFVKETFSAGLSCIQHKESMVSYFDGYIHPKSTLKQFLSKYEAAVQNNCEKEGQADSDSFHKSPQLITKLYMEEQIRKVYTVDMFKKFQEEVKAILYCIPTLIQVDGLISIFEVRECVKMKDGKEVNKNYGVTYNANEADVQCNCGSFQHGGILCRHSLSVLNFLEVYEIPSQYILERWRKDFKRRHTLSCSPNDFIANGPVERYDNLYKSCLRLAEIGSSSDDKYECALKIIHGAADELLVGDGTIDLQHKSMTYDAQANCSIMGGTADGRRSIGDGDEDIPDLMQVRRRGRPPKKRKEALVEKIVEASKKKVSQRKSMTESEPDLLQIGPNASHFDSHLWAQDGINLTEQVSPTNLSIGTHFGVQVNHPHAIDNQSGLRWGFQPMFQQSHTPEPPPGPWAG
ncbi:protein FAR1-RELATED SEQUENCE 6-like [Dioscorea cayenensis subsp. rotundata]|uniref:Protein FAR1-RELATED SEQUENCE n=1 Tax=Dioscorea cayennensis subsp. rotundata TaxID=55577 RepID=A0AB40CT52_DIOCR|nr:protein FAR1-RELATED SEQUENCE 6-like [Dioscorea cayenensis subsp. rotundata]XP_039143270.1 protein FAR1-RELATED SEQUENCE 6-like [Dioscorea cayenensis subsp. rotundata]XP_039143271.1 protein FAR1-RELATED SEQUENCE 6-like [Dioscorea cayenensis subsp. rotundata]XP_039143272.1 protein FAR1-RELATED SEQUENCE 6-like [Dioscorea cayenensis subsp. rotundata]XP_039143273.1 protein FAR1-RELATED SEQUENCE 6-like [Dioscorea cayenensis subsp. rotundata]